MAKLKFENPEAAAQRILDKKAKREAEAAQLVVAERRAEHALLAARVRAVAAGYVPHWNAVAAWLALRPSVAAMAGTLTRRLAPDLIDHVERPSLMLAEELRALAGPAAQATLHRWVEELLADGELAPGRLRQIETALTERSLARVQRLAGFWRDAAQQSRQEMRAAKRRVRGA